MQHYQAQQVAKNQFSQQLQFLNQAQAIKGQNVLANSKGFAYI